MLHASDNDAARPLPGYRWSPDPVLPQITVPVTIINGRHDRVVPLANAEFLDQRLPTSRLVIIDAGHFVWEEEPAKYASAVLDSITGNWPR